MEGTAGSPPWVGERKGDAAASAATAAPPTTSHSRGWIPLGDRASHSCYMVRARPMVAPRDSGSTRVLDYRQPYRGRRAAGSRWPPAGVAWNFQWKKTSAAVQSSKLKKKHALAVFIRQFFVYLQQCKLFIQMTSPAAEAVAGLARDQGHLTARGVGGQHIGFEAGQVRNM